MQVIADGSPIRYQQGIYPMRIYDKVVCNAGNLGGTAERLVFVPFGAGTFLYFFKKGANENVVEINNG